MPQPSQSLSLFRGAQAPSPPPTPPRAAARPDHLWLAVHLPDLVAEAVTEPVSRCPQVVIEQRHGRAVIVAAAPAARRLGIRAGLTLGAARALADGLEVVERSQAAERERLEALAVWADGLTPLKSIEPPDSLLLEIKGSLKLFGGVAAIESHVADELDRRGLSARLAAAPTPLGALWLARGGGADALTADALPGRLASIPLEATTWSEPVQRLLAEIGLATLGDVLRLPRAGLARRAGRECLHDLDRALGRRADPRAAFEAPPDFERRLELPAETHDMKLVVEALERLLEALGAHARERQLQAGHVEVVLHHRRAPPTVHAMSPVRPVHRPERLLKALTLGLERLALPGACIAVGLRAGALEPVRAAAPDLFARADAETGDPDEASAALIESLRSRLGADSVHGLALRAEHRPEKAWAEADAADPAGTAPVSPWVRRRPLWLLREPLPLERALGRFRLGRPLSFERGPERIEAGWWDDDDVRRDYFIAATPDGERLWTYRDHRAGDWYLHGIFG